MKKTLINYLGLLGVLSLLSYAAAVIFAPLAYPGYDWLRQAVSDLSADNAPSRALWHQLSSLYGVCGIVSATVACVFIRERLNKALRAGIYLFTWMNWVSYVGYALFPLTESGYAGTLQDVGHVAVTGAVVLLSIVSLVFIIIGGFKKRRYPSLALWAAIALALMFAGPVGIKLAPDTLFGVFERLSVFAAAGFTAVLGIYLFRGFPGYRCDSIRTTSAHHYL